MTCAAEVAPRGSPPRTCHRRASRGGFCVWHAPDRVSTQEIIWQRRLAWDAANQTCNEMIEQIEVVRGFLGRTEMTHKQEVELLEWEREVLQMRVTLGRRP